MNLDNVIYSQEVYSSIQHYYKYIFLSDFNYIHCTPNSFFLQLKAISWTSYIYDILFTSFLLLIPAI